MLYCDHGYKPIGAIEKQPVLRLRTSRLKYFNSNIIIKAQKLLDQNVDQKKIYDLENDLRNAETIPVTIKYRDPGAQGEMEENCFVT